MAAWDNYTQKVTPEDNDTLMIKDTVGAANKRTPFSGVWNWIVNKLTSAVISNLQTNSKSIIPAINELNSKSRNIWIDASGKNFEEVIPPNKSTGLYAFFNIVIPPASENPSSNYVRIIKLVEGAIIVTNGNIYFVESSSNTWNKTWKKVTSTNVSAV